ncbi:MULTISPECIES: helix-turn-helix domain-containing protein [Chryseobacterium group]|uniref:helix-turn-helix domain-containing protein n=1 Tax=Chryseobacterium group TaxID=2782232 RepID=UPI00082E653D|nr:MULTISPECIES: helix-turn-helix transcriptional regulator [Chryseobacterium group]QIY83881.1 helix-turn-helix transcriptional regulator [Chryseobacterium sp. NEB161]
MGKTFVFETTQFDYDFINHIKRLRMEKEISQEKLSLKMGLTKSFVGNVENIKENHKYSTRHIALLAKAFGFLNISELMDFPTPKYDKIKVTVKQIYNENGTRIVDNQILKIEPL